MGSQLKATTTAIFTMLYVALASSVIAAEEERLVVKMYDVAGLLILTPEFPYHSGLPTSSDAHGRQRMIHSGASHVPQSHQSNGGGGGGGFFSVPVDSLDATYRVTQFGASSATAENESSPTSMQLMELITEMVQPSSWSDSGAGQGSCGMVGMQLIVRQTESVHSELSAFLDQLKSRANASGKSYLMEAWWIPADADLLEQVHELKSSGQLTATKLNQLAQEADGLHAALRCEERRLSHTTSGVRRNFVRSVAPVVGTDAVGYSSIVDTVNLGTVLEARPVAASGTKSQATGENSTAQEFYLNLRSAVTIPHTQAITVRDDIRDLDRVAMDAHVFEGLCRVRLNEATIAGSTTTSPHVTWPVTNSGAVELLHIVLLTDDAN